MPSCFSFFLPQLDSAFNVYRLLAYLIYDKLHFADLLSQYSVSDFLVHLKYIHKIKENGSWVLSEIAGKTQKLLDALTIDIAKCEES